MALRRVHKFYLDSRAAKERSHGHADFIWTPDRPVVVDKCRAFIDSVHIPQAFGSIGTHNANTYVAEEQPDFTVLAGLDKVYLQETVSGTTTERVVQIATGTYANESALATALQTVLGGSYTVTAGSQTLAIANSGISWKIVARKQLQATQAFAGTPLARHALGDASDLLGTVSQAVQGGTGNVYLGKTLLYRKVTLTPGHRSADDLKIGLQAALTSGSTVGSYTVAFEESTGKLTVSAAGTFHIYSGHYLRSNPYDFPGQSAPWYAGDHATGLAFMIPTSGISLTGNQHVNLLPFSTLFINSDLGSHNDSIGPISQSSIARKIVRDVPHGGVIHDFHSQPLDFISLDKQSITSIRVHLCDWDGIQIQLDMPWSLSIILVPESEF